MSRRPPPPTNGAAPTGPAPTLAAFIAHALHRILFGPPAFISAFMIASKVIYSNKLWWVVGQGMFSLQEINQSGRCAVDSGGSSTSSPRNSPSSRPKSSVTTARALRFRRPFSRTLDRLSCVDCPARRCFRRIQQCISISQIVASFAFALRLLSRLTGTEDPTNTRYPCPRGTDVQPRVLATRVSSQRVSSVPPTIHAKVAEERIPERVQMFAVASSPYGRAFPQLPFSRLTARLHPALHRSCQVPCAAAAVAQLANLYAVVDIAFQYIRFGLVMFSCENIYRRGSSEKPQPWGLPNRINQKSWLI